MATNHNYNWDATDFFQRLSQSNRLAIAENFKFCRVAGLDGFHDALTYMQKTMAFICVDDVAQGYTALDNSPHTRRVKTVFMAMRHKIDDMVARQERFDTMRELFRQFMTVLIREKTKLEENFIYIDRRISFTEINEFFFSGCACARFSIAVDVQTDLRYDENEWTE